MGMNIQTALARISDKHDLSTEEMVAVMRQIMSAGATDVQIGAMAALDLDPADSHTYSTADPRFTISTDVLSLAPGMASHVMFVPPLFQVSANPS